MHPFSFARVRELLRLPARGQQRIGQLNRVDGFFRSTCTPLRIAVVMFVALLASGCASSPARTTTDDPWQALNRGVYKFNDTLDDAALKPVAKGYKKITPGWLRTGIGNLLHNIEYPATIINQFLQGKGVTGLKDTGRFLANTTLGLGGLFDVATSMGLEAHDEDLGQTLAVWGVPSGPFVTMPFFGPSNVRDAPSRIADFFLDPLGYIDTPWEVIWAKRGVDVVHTRAELLPIDSTLERTFDPYAFTRDAWIQQREFDIFDGNPPAEEYEDFNENDDPGAGEKPEPETP
jgi:phospholipid-binding lipoprotein MlaA